MSRLNEEELARELRARAGDVGGHPIDFDEVKRDAVTIRRHRRLLSGVAAAAVVAVVVPTAMAVTNGLNQGAQNPVDQPSPALTESVGPSPDPGPDEIEDAAIRLTTIGLQRGDAPGIDYLDGGFLVPTEGDRVNLGARYQGITEYDEGWIAVGADDNGNWSTYLLDPDGSVRSREPAIEGLAVSSDGSVVAYSTPDGKLMVMDGDGSPVQFNDPDAGRMSPVAVFGEGRCDAPEVEGGCVVFYNTDSAQPRSYLSSGHGIVERVGSFQALTDVASDRLAGRTSSSLTGSCSAVADQAFAEQWNTCDFRLRQFSPDGRNILATNAYGDGFGDTELAILDAETGETVVHYDGMGQDGNGVFIQDMVWEDETHVLAVTFQKGTWMVLRLDTGGNVEQATDGVEEDDMSRPYYLATQP